MSEAQEAAPEAGAEPDRPLDEVEASRAPLLDHLIELRSRLIVSLLAFAVATVIGYIIAGPIYGFLVQPLADVFHGDEGRRLIYTAPQEAFFTYLKVALFAGLCLSFPVLATQIYLFIAPGLYREERAAFLPYLLATPFLFVAGAAMVYYFIMPLALRFFVGFEVSAGEGPLPIQMETRVSEYLSLAMTLIFAFGLCFQLPVALSLLGRAGIVSASALRKGRKYAVVVTFAVAAVLTPPDVISQVGLGTSILLLYEISIWSVALIERGRAKRAAAEG